MEVVHANFGTQHQVGSRLVVDTNRHRVELLRVTSHVNPLRSQTDLHAIVEIVEHVVVQRDRAIGSLTRDSTQYTLEYGVDAICQLAGYRD